MPDLILRRALEGDADAMASLVGERCSLPGFRCLHSWQGESVAQLSAAFVAQIRSEEHLHVVLLHGDHMIGMAGAEFDRDLGCAWLHGPVMAAEALESAAAPLAFLLSLLPPGIHRWQVFLEEANGFTRELYVDRGFVERDRRYLGYVLEGEAPEVPKTVDFETLEEADRESFFQLLLELFPRPYWTKERMISMQGESMEITVRRDEDDDVCGFSVAYLEPGSGIGEVQYLGVREGHRGAGMGRELLQDSVDWLRSQGAKRIRLNAGSSATDALHLYESLGFRQQFVGVSLLRTVEPPF